MSDTPRFDPSRIVGLGPLLDRGRTLRRLGVPYVVQKLIPEYGGVGFYVAKAKVGKTTLGLYLMRCIARGSEFLGLAVTRRKVLMLALEDHRDYLAWLVAGAGFTEEDLEQIKFYPSTLVLNDATLADLDRYIRDGGFEFVYIATFMHGVRGLVDDENDNAGQVAVVASLKNFARGLEVPVFIEAHAGKGEDQSEEADPAAALRGASAGAGEADYVLNLRRTRGRNSTTRVLTGIGRFVNLQPTYFDLDPETGIATLVSDEDTRDADFEVVFAALSDEKQSAQELARAVGWVTKTGKPDKNHASRVHRALEDPTDSKTMRPGVDRSTNGKSDRKKRVWYQRTSIQPPTRPTGVEISTLSTSSTPSTLQYSQEEGGRALPTPPSVWSSPAVAAQPGSRVDNFPYSHSVHSSTPRVLTGVPFDWLDPANDVDEPDDDPDRMSGAEAAPGTD
jgi:hypothetical protein